MDTKHDTEVAIRSNFMLLTVHRHIRDAWEIDRGNVVCVALVATVAVAFMVDAFFGRFMLFISARFFCLRRKNGISFWCLGWIGVRSDACLAPPLWVYFLISPCYSSKVIVVGLFFVYCVLDVLFCHFRVFLCDFLGYLHSL